MKRILIALLISVIAVSGCVSGRTQVYYTAGIVSHDNSLTYALDQCIVMCADFQKSYTRGIVTPKLDQCTQKECQCLC